MTLKSIILTVLSFLSLTHPASAQSPEIRQLEAMWQRGEYSEVLEKLRAYRSKAEHRSAGVDYMIATSACRIPDKRRAGNQYFNWILKHYVLNKDDRKVIEDEQRNCSRRVAPARPPILTTPTQFGALFYVDKPGDYTKANTGRSSSTMEPYKVHLDEFDPETGAAIFEPVPLPLEELRGRLIEPSERHLAAQRVGAFLAGVVKAMSTDKEGQPLPPSFLPDLRFRVQTTEHFVLASFSGHTKAQLAAIGQDLEKYLEYYMLQYDMPTPPYLIAIYLVPDNSMLTDFAEDGHGINVSWKGTLGYSMPADQSIVAVTPRMIYGTLKHELFHLMVRNNFGDIPPWLEEGMATLYEASRVTPKGIVGVPSWRARALRERGRRWPRISELVAMDWQTFLIDPEAEDFYDEEKKFDWYKEMRVGRNQELNHSVARYFALYLQEKGKLSEVYHAFREMKVNDNPDEETVKILESILQQPLDDIDADFVSWFKRVDGYRQTPNRHGRVRKR